MNTNLNHIFDHSACFTKRQLKDYAQGSMSPEERYAAEHHLNSCLLCSSAIDGILASPDAYAVLDNVNHTFLKEHFIQTSPQVHLNSLTMTAPAAPKRRLKGKGPALVKPSTVAAAVLLSIGALWYMEFGKKIHYNPAPRPAATVSAAAPVTSDGEELFSNGPQKDVEPNYIAVAPNAAPASEEPQTQPLLATAAPAEKKEHAKPEKQKAVDDTNGKVPAKQNGTTQIVRDEPAEGQRAITAPKEDEPRADSGEKKEDIEDTAGQLFESGRYGAALSTYKQMMQSSDRRTRQEATLMAARCYMNLGKKNNAVELLEALASNGSGSQKRTAKRMLRQMSGDTAE